MLPCVHEKTFPELGPDLRSPPLVRPRTAVEVQLVREAMRDLSAAIRRAENYARRRLGVVGRMIWLNSFAPLSTPDDIRLALALADHVANHVTNWQGDGINDKAQRVVERLSDLVDDMQTELEEDSATDRRRSVALDDVDETSHRNAWKSVPARDLDLLYSYAATLVEGLRQLPKPLSSDMVAFAFEYLAPVVERIREVRRAVSSGT